MDTKFQTSFIPRKSLTPASTVAPAKQQNTSILLLIGVFVFVISILAAAGSYGWQKYLETKQAEYGVSLKTLEKNFNTNSIVALKTTATKIDLASALLKNHIALSQVFSALSSITAENIRFTSLNIDMTVGKTRSISLKANGYAPSYDALAFQSDQLNHLESLGVKNIISNPMISNPVQNQDSTVSFVLTADISPDSMLYSKTLTNI
ncbi:MAG: hypothetical protein WCO48_01120 [Candidatus Taylorbacteria bacterium]